MALIMDYSESIEGGAKEVEILGKVRQCTNKTGRNARLFFRVSRNKPCRRKLYLAQ